jgi:hypothetical protein
MFIPRLLPVIRLMDYYEFSIDAYDFPRGNRSKAVPVPGAFKIRWEGLSLGRKIEDPARRVQNLGAAGICYWTLSFRNRNYQIPFSKTIVWIPARLDWTFCFGLCDVAAF